MNKGLGSKGLLPLFLLVYTPARAAVIIAYDTSIVFDLPGDWTLAEPEADGVILDAVRDKTRFQITLMGEPLAENILQNKNLLDIRSLGARGAAVPEEIARDLLPSKEVVRSIVFELNRTNYRTGYFNFGTRSYSFFSQNLSKKEFSSFLTTIGTFPRPPRRERRPRSGKMKNTPERLEAAAQPGGHKDCLAQITECFDETKNLSDCVDDADLCPKNCRDEFFTMSQGRTSTSEAFQEIFMDPDSPCRLEDNPKTRPGPDPRPSAPRQARRPPVRRPQETSPRENTPPEESPEPEPRAAEPAAPPPVVAPHDLKSTPADHLKECGRQVIDCLGSDDKKALDPCVEKADKCPDICRQEYARLSREGVTGMPALQKIFLEDGAICKPKNQ